VAYCNLVSHHLPGETEKPKPFFGLNQNQDY